MKIDKFFGGKEMKVCKKNCTVFLMCGMQFESAAWWIKVVWPEPDREEWDDKIEKFLISRPH